MKISTVQGLMSTRETLILYVIILLGWGLYRLLFRLPTWFEEIILKALAFGVPVYYFARRHDWHWKELGVTGLNLRASVYMGMVLGMVLGIAGNLGNIIRHGGLVWSSFGLTSQTVGGFIVLSMVTAFWEQLLFCGVFMRLVADSVWNEWAIAWIIAILFVGLHIPSLVFIQHLPLDQLAISIILLVLLQLGNVILMLRYKNLAAPLMAQALWGVTVFLFR